MAINNLSIENFTVFNKITMDFSDGINVFIGDNGTGKTHLLKVIYSLCEWKSNSTLEDLERLTAKKLHECFQKVSFKNLTYFKSSVLENEIPIKIISQINGINRSYKIYDYTKNINDFEYEAVGDFFLIPSIFIPAKDMLTHSGLEKDYIDRYLPIDATLINILNKAGVSAIKKLSKERISIMNSITQIIGGKIVYKNDCYYTEKSDGTTINFAAEAEGFKKLGLIYRLIETGYLENGSVLIWDEPEANLNPKWFPYLVDILMKLAMCGVQVFLATHEYNFLKYLSFNKINTVEIAYFNLHKTADGLTYERENDYNLLEHNDIINANSKMLEDEIELD